MTNPPMPLEENFFDLEKLQTFRVNNCNHLDLGASVAMNFFSRCFDWFRLANLKQKKIRIVLEYDPNSGSTIVTFSKID